MLYERLRASQSQQNKFDFSCLVNCLYAVMSGSRLIVEVKDEVCSISVQQLWNRLHGGSSHTIM